MCSISSTSIAFVTLSFMGQAQIIDTDHFHDYVGNDTAEIEFMIDLFIQQSSTYYMEIELAYKHDDVTEWHDVAHKFKGMAGFTGATHLYATCKQAQEDHKCTKEQKLSLLKTIEQDIENAISFLKDYQGQN